MLKASKRKSQKRSINRATKFGKSGRRRANVQSQARNPLFGSTSGGGLTDLDLYKMEQKKLQEERKKFKPYKVQQRED